MKTKRKMRRPKRQGKAQGEQPGEAAAVEMCDARKKQAGQDRKQMMTMTERKRDLLGWTERKGKEMAMQIAEREQRKIDEGECMGEQAESTD